MKTRTLLLLAAACGLVILVAGGIKILLLAEEEPPAHLAVGQTGTAGDMTVTIREPVTTGSQLLITAELQGVDDENGAAAFRFVNGQGQFDPERPPTDAGPACAATSATAPTTCVLAFATTDPHGLLLYERTTDDVLRWDIGRIPAGATVATAETSPSG